MTLDQASEISRIWSLHLEHSFGKLNFIFMASIPESFLPFPKDVIEEALNILAEEQHKYGNRDAVEGVKAAGAFLVAYKDDQEAILQAAKRFSNPEWCNAVIPKFKVCQQTWIKSQGDF